MWAQIFTSSKWRDRRPAQDYDEHTMTLKLRAFGTRTGVIFPKDLLAQLGVKEGDELFAIPTRDGLLLSP